MPAVSLGPAAETLREGGPFRRCHLPDPLHEEIGGTFRKPSLRLAPDGKGTTQALGVEGLPGDGRPDPGHRVPHGLTSGPPLALAAADRLSQGVAMFLGKRPREADEAGVALVMAVTMSTPQRRADEKAGEEQVEGERGE